MANKANGKRTETVHVALLIDETGLMAGMEPAVIGGVNEFIEKLRADEAEARVSATLAMFDTHANDPILRVRYEDIPLPEVATLEPGEYCPRGATPLNDAVVGAIRTLERAAGTGDRAMLVILTDGLENSSETSSAKVRKLIIEKERAGWEFIYLGADQDTWEESEKIGLAAPGKQFAFDKSDPGARAAFRASADRARSFRDDARRYKKEQSRLGDKVDPDYKSEPRKRRRRR